VGKRLPGQETGSNSAKWGKKTAQRGVARAGVGAEGIRVPRALIRSAIKKKKLSQRNHSRRMFGSKNRMARPRFTQKGGGSIIPPPENAKDKKKELFTIANWRSAEGANPGKSPVSEAKKTKPGEFAPHNHNKGVGHAHKSAAWNLGSALQKGAGSLKKKSTPCW